MFTPDEPRYAEVPREMIASGDWIVPRLNGLRYFEKPVLGYWLNGASMLVFGENGFAVRLPSALAAGLSALLVYILARRHFSKDALVPPLAALVLLTCFEVVGVGTFAVLDTMVSFFLTGAMFFFFDALASPSGSWRERGRLVAAGVFCGLAFLTKGFLAFVVPALAVGGFMIWQGRWRELFRVVWLPLAVAVLISLPWGLLIHIREADFWNFFFWNEHVRRFIGDDAQHKESFWFFIITAPAMFLPWTFVVPAAVQGLKNNRDSLPAQIDLIRFCICWLLLPFLFFSASSGKLLTYILPCFPPFSLLMAVGLARNLRDDNDNRFQLGVIGAAFFFGLLLIIFSGIQLAGFTNFNGIPPYDHFWKGLMTTAALAAIPFFLIIAARSRENRIKLLAFGFSPVLLFLTLPGNLPDLLVEKKAPGAFLVRHASEITPATIVVSDGDIPRAVSWYFKRDDVYYLNGCGELTYGLQYEDSRHRLLDLAALRKLIKENPGKVVFAGRGRNYAKWQGHLPEPRSFDSSGSQGAVFVTY